MKRLLIVVTVLLFAVILNAADKGAVAGKQVEDKKTTDLKESTQVANHEQRIEKLEALLQKKLKIGKQEESYANMCNLIQELKIEIAASRKLQAVNDENEKQKKQLEELKSFEKNIGFYKEYFEKKYNYLTEINADFFSKLNLWAVLVTLVVAIVGIGLPLYITHSNEKKHSRELATLEIKIEQKEIENAKIIEDFKFIGDNIKQEVRQMIKDVEAPLHERMKDSFEEVKEYFSLESWIATGRVVRLDGSVASKNTIIKKLNFYRAKYPQNKYLFTVLSLLYSSCERYNEAINVLEEYLENIDYCEGKTSISLAVVPLFNLACYHSLLIEGKKSTLCRDNVINYLSQALKDPTRKNSADGDKDFENMRKYFPEAWAKLMED